MRIVFCALLVAVTVVAFEPENNTGTGGGGGGGGGGGDGGGGGGGGDTFDNATAVDIDNTAGNGDGSAVPATEGIGIKVANSVRYNLPSTSASPILNLCRISCSLDQLVSKF